jgi:hypothetical protein
MGVSSNKALGELLLSKFTSGPGGLRGGGWTSSTKHQISDDVEAGKRLNKAIKEFNAVPPEELLAYYIERFLEFPYTPHLMLAFGTGAFSYWMMYYHPEVMTAFINGISKIGADIVPDDIEVNIG